MLQHMELCGMVKHQGHVDSQVREYMLYPESNKR